MHFNLQTYYLFGRGRTSGIRRRLSERVGRMNRSEESPLGDYSALIILEGAYTLRVAFIWVKLSYFFWPDEDIFNPFDIP